MQGTRARWLAAFLLLALGAPIGAADRTESGPGGGFSIVVPESWRVVPSRSEELEQLALFATEPFDISIVVSSRPLDPDELALDRRQLLDLMIERTMIQTAELGNEVVEVGRVDPIHEDWPAFALVATNPDRTKIMTSLRSFVDDRAYTVTTMTDNLQASAELGATVTRVVRSLTLHPRDPS